MANLEAVFPEKLTKPSRFPWLTVASSTLVGVATANRERDSVQRLSEVRPRDSFGRWLRRSPLSFFVGEPLYGTPKDTALNTGLTALAFGLVERKYGASKTAEVAATGHALACLATRLTAEVGLVPESQRDQPDTGSSGGTVALLTYYFTRRAGETLSPIEKFQHVSTNVVLALGAAAVALPNVSVATAHLAGAMAGISLGIDHNRADLAFAVAA